MLSTCTGYNVSSYYLEAKKCQMKIFLGCLEIVLVFSSIILLSDVLTGNLYQAPLCLNIYSNDIREE